MRATVLAVLAMLAPIPASGQECSQVAEVGDQVRVTQRRSTVVRFLMAVSEDDGSYGGQLASVTEDSLRVEWAVVGLAGGKTLALADIQSIEKRCPIRRDRVGRAAMWGGTGVAASLAIVGWAFWRSGDKTPLWVFVATVGGLGAGIGALTAPSSRYVPASVQPVTGDTRMRSVQLGFRIRVR